VKIIAGLGNPGSKHAGQRHNIGFMAADSIARRHSFAPWWSKFSALVCEGSLGGEKTLLIKPQGFMNLSGQAVGEAMRFYKLSVDDLIVLYDELDLAPGKVKIKRGGGSGGHNGIRSLDSHCGADYLRVRLGIGHPGDKTMVTNWVLGDFAKADQVWLQPLLDALAEHAGLLVTGQDNEFMNRLTLALRVQPDAVKAAARGQSHIRQARGGKPDAPVPATGPMAAMLRKLLGPKE
jgi:PTH1 family peptidyl-tRNA hydrolase